MIGETAALAAKKLLAETALKSAETGAVEVVEASQLAELGAVKPPEYGTIAKNAALEGAAKKGELESISQLNPLNDSIDYFGYFRPAKEDFKNLSPEQTAKDVALTLRDYDITKEAWESADLLQRGELIKQAATHMSEALSIPKTDFGAMDVLVKKSAEMSKGAKAYFECPIEHLANGGVKISGKANLYISEKLLKGDFTKAMTEIFEEVSSYEQLAKINSVDPSILGKPQEKILKSLKNTSVVNSAELAAHPLRDVYRVSLRARCFAHAVDSLTKS